MYDQTVLIDINEFLGKTMMTKTEFAKRIGCPHCTVSRWLNGHVRVSPAFVMVIRAFIKNYKPARTKAKLKGA